MFQVEKLIDSALKEHRPDHEHYDIEDVVQDLADAFELAMASFIKGHVEKVVQSQPEKTEDKARAAIEAHMDAATRAVKGDQHRLQRITALYNEVYPRGTLMGWSRFVCNRAEVLDAEINRQFFEALHQRSEGWR